MSNNTFIDVRPILAAEDCPFDTVIDVAKAMQPGDTLTLQAPFNPVPLQQALAGIGVDLIGVEKDKGRSFVVEFRFTPIEEKSLEEIIDLTDLEPPQPMVRITEILAAAQPGDFFGFRTRFKPVHMLNALDPEATLTASREQSNGTWITRILKREVVKCEH